MFSSNLFEEDLFLSDSEKLLWMENMRCIR